MKNHTCTLFFFRKFGKMLKNLLSAAVVIGALRVKNKILSVVTIECALILCR